MQREDLNTGLLYKKGDEKKKISQTKKLLIDNLVSDLRKKTMYRISPIWKYQMMLFYFYHWEAVLSLEKNHQTTTFFMMWNILEENCIG